MMFAMISACTRIVCKSLASYNHVFAYVVWIPTPSIITYLKLSLFESH